MIPYLPSLEWSNTITPINLNKFRSPEEQLYRLRSLDTYYRCTSEEREQEKARLQALIDENRKARTPLNVNSWQPNKEFRWTTKKLK